MAMLTQNKMAELTQRYIPYLLFHPICISMAIAVYILYYNLYQNATRCYYYIAILQNGSLMDINCIA